jgi:AbrB family looped-hinge helix DNA binding protein
MKITTKGQVTIPQDVRERAGMHPHSEVSFEVLPSGDVLLRRSQSAGRTPATGAGARVSAVRQAFERVRGSANAPEFKGMGTDEFMAYLRT